MSSAFLVFVIIIIVLALSFDYVNGFHDTANAIATTISTKAMSPGAAIIMAASLDLLGALVSTKVAETVGKGIVHTDLINMYTIIAALIGAIIWNLITWYFGIPSSSSHALVGGLVGATLVNSTKVTGIFTPSFAVHVDFSVVYWKNLLFKVVLPLIFTPIVGFIIGSVFMITLLWFLKSARPNVVNKYFLKLQIVSSALVAFSHGANDAQKSMGIITLALVTANFIPSFHVPFWVKVSCASALALGTLTGGWKIIKTIGNKISKLRPVNGFAAQTSAAFAIGAATLMGAPVSTTHIVSSSIMGVGATKRLSAVKWKKALELVYTWFITIPSTAVITGTIYFIITAFVK